ncbi:MAG: hypothetical protein A2V67_12380 [Deltaproteobacteria bacterium RBG_13_61_14]|nr:MAG: hypothetical protein A2V67_12380 [Deltaproteobacteria bacterium RBG_13_61_14]
MAENGSGDRSLLERIRAREDLTGADLTNLDLSEQELVGARLARCQGHKTNFMKAKLRYADFHDAALREAYFIGANLLEANFENADLRGADFYLADLTKAKLKGANFEGANLEGANLQGADLTRTNLRTANLNKANLLDAITFETEFRGASMLDTKTLRETPKRKSAFGSQLTSALELVPNLYIIIIAALWGAFFGALITAVYGKWWMVPASMLMGVVIGAGVSYLIELISTKAPDALYGRKREEGYSEVLYRGDLAHAIFLYRHERWPEALEAYLEILGKDPDKLEPQFRIARIYHQGLRDLEKAREAYQQIIDRYAKLLGEGHMYILESRRGLKELGVK